jgi:hypothetical protein
MVDLKPFEGAANRTAVAVFGKGRPIRYPVSYQYWKRRAGRAGRIGFDTPYEDITKERITFRAWQGKPVDATDVTSAWITARPGCLRVLDKIIGPSDYVGRKGITCGVNGVFWLSIHATRPGGDLIVANVPERGKKVVSATQAAVEPALVYPLLRGMDVSRWMVRHELSVLLTHKPGMRLKAIPEGDMQREYPKAWQYLTRYRTILRQAAIFRRFFRPSDPFYSVFNVGDYTFAPHKVLIREIAGSLTSAVAADYQGKPSIPDHKLVLVACDTSDEAHFLCAALNSRPAMLLAQSYGITTQFSTHIFRLLRISRFQPGNQAHVHLASLSRQAHQAAELGEAGRLTEIETQIDDSSRYLWNLTQDDLKEIGRGLEDI